MLYLDYEIEEFALWRNGAPETYVTGTVSIRYTSCANWCVEQAEVTVYTSENDEEREEVVYRGDFLCLLIDGALAKFEREEIERAIVEDAAAQSERIREEMGRA